MTRKRLTSKKASPPPATPGYKEYWEKRDEIHPAAYVDPDKDQYKTGDPSSWAEDPHPAPYRQSRHPAIPWEGSDHPAVRPDQLQGVTKAQVEKKAKKAVKVASRLLGKKASDEEVYDQAMALMDLPESHLDRTLENLESPSYNVDLDYLSEDPLLDSSDDLDLFASDDEDEMDDLLASDEEESEDEEMEELLAELDEEMRMARRASKKANARKKRAYSEEMDDLLAEIAEESEHEEMDDLFGSDDEEMDDLLEEMRMARLASRRKSKKAKRSRWASEDEESEDEESEDEESEDEESDKKASMRLASLQRTVLQLKREIQTLQKRASEEEMDDLLLAQVLEEMENEESEDEEIEDLLASLEDEESEDEEMDEILARWASEDEESEDEESEDEESEDEDGKEAGLIFAEEEDTLGFSEEEMDEADEEVLASLYGLGKQAKKKAQEDEESEDEESEDEEVEDKKAKKKKAQDMKKAKKKAQEDEESEDEESEEEVEDKKAKGKKANILQNMKPKMKQASNQKTSSRRHQGSDDLSALWESAPDISDLLK